MAGILLDYKTQWAQDKEYCMHWCIKKLKLLEGDLECLLALPASSLQTGTMKFQQDNVGPLVIDSVRFHTLRIERSWKWRAIRYISY